ncbi:MAG: FtsX-like permease family protein [Candidatus Saccharimonas sp.]
MKLFTRFFKKRAKTSKPAKLSSIIRPKILGSIALQNLLSKRQRTFLTIGGITIGVGAIVFLVSLADGLHGVVDQQVIGSRSVKTIDVTSPNSVTIPLDTNRSNKLKDIAHVDKIAPAYIIPGKISKGGSLTDAVLYGTTNDYINLSAIQVSAGVGQLKNEHDAIISSSLLSLIGESNPNKAIGQKVSVLTSVTQANGDKKAVKETLDVVGVANISSGVAVYMDEQLLNDAGASEYGQMKVVADDRANVPTIRKQIASLGLTTTSPLDTLDDINTIFTIFTFVVVGFGGIGMFIAILGMFNTLTISLLERTSEIGLMVTMGARKADIQRLLIFEALILSFVGGLGGIFIAWMLGLGINFGLTYFANSRGVPGSINAFSVTPSLVLVTIAFTLLVGLVVSLYPSRRATKINPIEALRYE